MSEKRFNIRVYGICEIAENFLVTDEIIDGYRMTKFVGGGVEWGEGVRDALIREFKEECEVDILETEHFYTTEQFQESAFRSGDQLISIYYRVKIDGPHAIPIVQEPFENLNNNQQCFRWVHKTMLINEHFTFPLDQEVVRKICHL